MNTEILKTTSYNPIPPLDDLFLSLPPLLLPLIIILLLALLPLNHRHQPSLILLILLILLPLILQRPDRINPSILA